MGLACWSSRRRSRFSCGAECGPMAALCWPSCAGSCRRRAESVEEAGQDAGVRTGTDKTTMTSTSRPGPARWIIYGISVMAIAAIATQIYFFVMVGVDTVVNPSETACMRADAWRLRQDRPELSIQHDWV